MSTPMSLREVFERLDAEGFDVPDSLEGKVSQAELADRGVDSPWYVRFFMGLSAWVAAVFLLSFLSATAILFSDPGSMVIGLVFCAGAVGLNRLAPRNDFLIQLALALSLAGQALFTFGAAEWWEAVVPVAMALIALEALLLWIYEDRLHRFISSVIVAGAVLALVLDLESTIGLHLLIFVVGACSVLVNQREYDLLHVSVRSIIVPASYGMIVSFLGLLTLPLVGEFRDVANVNEVQWWITAGLLLFVLLYVVSQIVADLNLELRSRAVLLLLLGCVLLGVPAARMPGLLGALIVLVMGFWRNNRLLLGLSTVFLVFYLGAYYYTLEWTLLVKSFVLMGTGVTMLLLRFGLVRVAQRGQL